MNKIRQEIYSTLRDTTTLKMKEYYESIIEQIYIKNGLFNTNNYYEEYGVHAFRELNVICISAPRQSGKTTTIKRMFNIHRDYYIGHSLNMANTFTNPSYDINNGDVKFSFTKEQANIINNRKCIKSTSSNIDWVREIPKGEVVIYIDLSSVNIPDYNNRVQFIIDEIMKHYSDDLEELYKKVVVYT